MEIEKLIDDYTQWLRKEITVEDVGNFYEITTPFLDNSNDYIQFYVKLDGDAVFFTDDGFTLSNLNMSSLSSSRKTALKLLLSRYGVSLDGLCLTAKADSKSFSQKKHMFVQAIMAVDDMFMTARGKGSSSFVEDLQSYFFARDIYYTDNVQFSGISGFSHNYEFLMQRTKNMPERLCRVVNNPTKNNMVNVLFAWNDTKPARKSDSQLVVLLNDENQVASGVEDGFRSYDAKVLRWTEKDSDSWSCLLTG